MIQNTVTMIGNLVEDPILRRTNTDNRPVANATIAVNEPTARAVSVLRTCVLWFGAIWL